MYICKVCIFKVDLYQASKELLDQSTDLLSTWLQQPESGQPKSKSPELLLGLLQERHDGRKEKNEHFA